MRKLSRRELVGCLLASLIRPVRVTGQLPPVPSRVTSRTYRADAVILLLGISIYKRAGVGGGRASLEETGEGPSLRRTLFFAGGSDPKQAHGVRRLGWIQEVLLGPVSTPSEASYFGVLTSSPEESLDHARKSVATPSSGLSLFSAVNGCNTPGHSRSAVTHFEFADSALWSDRGLIEHAQSTFGPKVDWRETSWPAAPAQTPPTFLSQLEALLNQRSRRAQGRYVYNEQEYLLSLDTQPARDHQVQVHGVIRNLRTSFETPFRLWLDNSGSIVPVRIEFQPRSFLRLTFESIPA
jgi:hypothetical protein